MTNDSNLNADEHKTRTATFEAPTGTVVLTPPVTGSTDVPIIEANLEHKNNLTPKGLAAVLVPRDGKKRTGYVLLHLSNDKFPPNEGITKYSTVVASACEGHEKRTHFGQAVIEVSNVVPSASGLEILINIRSEKDIDYRAHIIIYF
jgi:hypothetical protein